MVLGLPFLPQETIWGIVCSESPIWPWTIAPQMGNWDSVRECNAKDNKALGCRGNTVVDNDNIYHCMMYILSTQHLYTNIFNTYIAQALAVASEQCVTITETSLKNITLVNFLIILILIIVVAANVNEGNFLTMLTMMKWRKSTIPHLCWPSFVFWQLFARKEERETWSEKMQQTFDFWKKPIRELG